jgi:hypothetical protein
MSNTKKEVEERKYAIPVGTSNLIEFSKFLVDLRDPNCDKCRTGYKSVIPKFVGGKVHQIPVMCTCVPYIASMDKDGNMTVVFKGLRELWPGKKRPEQYVQNDMIRKAEFDRAKENLKSAHDGARAHNNVQSGKYTLGPLSPAERSELGKDLVKSLVPKFDGKDPADLDKAPSTPAQFIRDNITRKVSMRNSEGHIIVVDNATALNMMKKNIAVPERPGEAPEGAPPPPPSPGRKRRGRPTGSTNKPKPEGSVVKPKVKAAVPKAKAAVPKAKAAPKAPPVVTPGGLA